MPSLSIQPPAPAPADLVRLQVANRGEVLAGPIPHIPPGPISTWEVGAVARVGSVRHLASLVAGVAVGALLVTANGLIIGPRTASGIVHIAESNWNITWASGGPKYPVSIGSFEGGCLTLKGSFAPSSNTSCLLVNADARQGGVEVLFHSVTVNPPFAAAFGPPTILYCLNCNDITVNITMPAAPGNYTLDATVMLTT